MRSVTRQALHALLILSLLLPSLMASAGSAAAASTAPSTRALHKRHVVDAAKLSAAAAPVSAGLTRPEPRVGQRPDVTDPAQVAEALRSAPVMFIENVGQFDSQARFQVRGAGGLIHLASDALWVTLLEPLALPAPAEAAEPALAAPFDLAQLLETPRRGVHLRLSFVGANPNPQIVGFDPLDTTVSFFIGNDPAQWRADVPAWGGVRYVDLYPGVDLEIASQGGRWAWRLVARQNPNPAVDREVRLRVQGADALALEGERLRLSTAAGDFTLPLLDVTGSAVASLIEETQRASGQTRPTIRGEEVLVPFAGLPAQGSAPTSAHGRLRLAFVPAAAGGRIPALQATNPADLLYSTFLGVGGTDEGQDIAVDTSGAAYVTGPTNGATFPTTPGAFDTTYNGYQDVFVTKLNPSGTGLVYSTFLGGGGTFGEFGYGLALDASGAAYVTGYTNASNFPLVNAYDSTRDGRYDAFVSKLNPSGSALLYSTYLGGSGNNDKGFGIAVDASGAAYVVGDTDSTDFPTAPTPGAYDTSCGGCPTSSDAFVTKLNPAESGAASLVYSTFLGGSSTDNGNAIAVDASGAAYVTGYTGSSDFPATGGATHTGGDTFITKFNAAGTGLVYSTFIDGTSSNSGWGIAVDGSGAAYLTGRAVSGGFPTTPGAFNPTGGGSNDAFVAKLNAAGSALVYSTFLGGGLIDNGEDIALDAGGAAYITGSTYGSNFPTTPGAAQTTFGGEIDAFVTKLNRSGSGLLYSTYLGGSGNDYGLGIAPDVSGAAYATGRTGSANFPTSPGAFDTTYTSPGADAFVTALWGPDLLDAAILNLSRAKGVGLPDRRNCVLVCWLNGVLYLVGDPINTRTGGVDTTIVDLSFPALGGQMVFQRSYSSLATNLYTTTLGYGWTHNHDTRLITPTMPGGVAGQILFKPHGGSRVIFYIDPGGTFTPYPGVLAQLVTTTAPSGYRVTAADQSTYTFDTGGRLLTWADAQGHAWTYTYNGAGQLTQVADSSGQRFLTLGYDPTTGRLTSVADPLSQTVQYGYDGNGDLTTVVDVTGQTWTYAYDGTSHRLSERLDPLGRTVERIEYDGQGRAVRQFDALGMKTLEIAYTPASAGLAVTATITDALGAVTTAFYDGRGTLMNLKDAAGSSTSQDLDVNFRATRATDALSRTTQLTWSGSGANLTQVVDALTQTTQLAYDSLNNLTQTVDARGNATNFTYAGSLLTATTDALLNTSRYTYTTAADGVPTGLLKETSDAVGRLTRYQYDSLGQRTVLTDAAGIVTTYGYDTLGRVVTTTTALRTPLQVVTLNQYDAAGRLTQATRNYLAGQPQNYLNRYNLVTRTGYDAVGNQTRITDTLGLVTRSEYDPLNRPVTVTVNYVDGAFDPNKPDEDIRTVTQYDSSGNVVSTTQYAGTSLARTSFMQYDTLNRPVTVTTNYAPGLSGPDKNITTTTQYDANGNVVTTTQFYGIAGLERKAYTQYDVLNRPVTVTTNYVDGAFNSAEPDKDIPTVTLYDTVGNVLTTTQFYGISGLERKTYTQYDVLNRPVTVTVNYDNGQFVSSEPDRDLIALTAYDAAGSVISATHFSGWSQARVSHTLYDSAGRPVTGTVNYVDGVFNGNEPDRDVIQTTSYGPAGERQATTEQRGGPGLVTTLITTTYAYDNLGRLITTTWPLTGSLVASTTVTYDALGRVVDRIDPLGQKTRTQYDALGRPVTVTVNYVDGAFNPTKPDEDLATVTTYDAAGNRVQVKDPKGIVTRFEYDLLNRLVAVVENYVSGGPVDSQTNVRTEYTYDAAGNLKTLKDGRAQVTSFTYDLLNRQVSATDPLTQTTQYVYDAASNQVRLIDAKAQTITSTYDLLNRLVNINYPDATPDATFTYDAAGQRTQLVDGQGTTTWAYDLLSRALTITQPFTNPVIYAYDSAGDRLSLKYPDGKVVTYTYDLATRLIRVSDWQTQATSYTYDTLGQPLSVALPNGVTTTYAYDGAHRLTTIAAQTLTQTLSAYTYTLDAVGHRTAVSETLRQPDATLPTTAITYTYDSLYRLTDATYSTGSVFTYTYDAVGNRLTQTTLTNTTVYTYDIANRLVNVGGTTYTWDANGNLLNDGTSTYTYDAANRPITITQGANTYGFAYNGQGDRLRQTVNGVTTTYALDLNAGLIQVLADGANTYLYGPMRIGEQQPGGFAYHLPDALGSVRQLTNANGAVTLARSYEPFGTTLASSGTGETLWQYVGEQRDPTGLTFLRARYLSTALGRFFQPDIWTGDYERPQTLNRYAYVGNNVINVSDPSGQCYPPAEFLRDFWPENINCANLDLALIIFSNSNATYPQRSAASAYIAAWGVGHAYLLGGLALSGYAAADAVVAWAGPYVANLPIQYPWLGTTATAGAAGVEGYLAYRGLFCKDIDAAAFLMTGYSLTGQSALLNLVSGISSRFGLVQRTQAMLRQAAGRASASVGAGSGGAHGTYVHSAFRNEVQALGRTDLYSEITYLNGQVATYGTAGGVRVDVVLGTPQNPIAIYDLKTGSATLDAARIQQIRMHLPVQSQDIPILEIRP